MYADIMTVHAVRPLQRSVLGQNQGFCQTWNERPWPTICSFLPRSSPRIHPLLLLHSTHQRRQAAMSFCCVPPVAAAAPPAFEVIFLLTVMQAGADKKSCRRKKTTETFISCYGCRRRFPEAVSHIWKPIFSNVSNKCCHLGGRFCS